MKTLATYVGAIHNRPGTLSYTCETVAKSCREEQGFEVCEEITMYRFSDGVIIRRTVEQDKFPSDAACAECWIIYEVVSYGDSGIGIDPPRKVFENACRESFWLTYHM